jgi:hypothetical protein
MTLDQFDKKLNEKRGQFTKASFEAARAKFKQQEDWKEPEAENRRVLTLKVN